MRSRKLSKKHVIILFFSLFMLLGGLVLVLEQTNQRQNTDLLAAGDCTVSSSQMQIKQQEETMYGLINLYREQNGKTPLAWNQEFKRPAAWMSKDLLTTKNLSHTDSLGRTPDVRIRECNAPATTSFGENIAAGAPSAREVLDAWKNSPPHNQILLSTAFNQGAVAMEVDSTGEIAYWVLVVGGPGTSNPIITGPIATPSGNITGTVTPTLETQPTIKPGKDPTPTLGPEGVNVQISVKVKIAGIGKDGNPAPKNLTRHVTAMVYGVGEEPVATGNSFLTYDNQEYFTGTIQLGKLNQGPYFVKLVSDNSLQTLAKPEFQMLKIDQVNPIPAVTLYQGDLTRDNIIDINDYNAVLPCFQDKRCDQAKSIDFNDDGNTDAKDYNLLLKSFGQQLGN